VKHENKWGSVCSHGFTEKAAMVACRSMGLPGSGVSRNYGGRFRKGGYGKVRS